MTSTTLCKSVPLSMMAPWTLSDDSAFVFFLPDGTAKYAKFGETVTVPQGTHFGFTGAISYTHLDSYTITGVSVGVYVEYFNFGSRYHFNYSDVTDPGDVTEIINNDGSCAMVISGLPLEQSCTLKAQMLMHTASLDGLAMELPHAATTVNVVSAETSTATPLAILGCSFSNPEKTYYPNTIPAGSTYNMHIGIRNANRASISKNLNLKINGVTKSPIPIVATPADEVTWIWVDGLVSTGNDNVCFTFEDVEPPGGILDWIENNILLTAVGGMAALIGITYLMTRKR